MAETSSQARGAAYGLLAAALFGASAPLSKRLLADASPLVLAGLLYLGAGGGAALTLRLRRSIEPSLQRVDLPLLAGVTVFGGILGPALMLVGLSRMTGVAGSLLLNLEAPFTMALALLFFREHLGPRQVLAAGLIVVGGALLGWRPGSVQADPLGVLAIAGACLSWGLDNNLTQRLSVRSPLAIVRVKASVAGAFNLALGLALVPHLPRPGVVVGAWVLGALSYGVSIALDVQALRLLGAAREAAYFATAPFAGALLALPLLGERGSSWDLFAAAVMATGVVALLRERHRHAHHHHPLDHEHLHTHDEHHRHAHPGPFTEPHSHPHHHSPLIHDHPHVPDLHHRHRHS